MATENVAIGESAEDTPLLRNSMRRPRPTGCDEIIFDSVIARLYLNPCLLHQEQGARVPKDLELPPAVRAIKDSISRNLANCAQQGKPLFESFYGGDLSLCGSVAEGTKVGGADEFDFQYLMTVNGLEATPKRLLRTKPRSANGQSRSFYSLRVEHDGILEEIEASAIQDRFLNKIKQLLSNIHGEFEVKKAGPAVKISYKDDKGRIIKIDLTLGLRADVKGIAHLTQLAKSLDGNGGFKCHYVAAHDYWKICFVETEQALLRDIIEADEVKGAVYRIIKLLRDEADIKDPYGDGILPSYPIKVTFLDIAYQDHVDRITWSIQDVTFHVIKILREVERRGLSHSLCCLFLDSDDVMGEADRSYLESRRLLNELKSKERHYISLRRRLVCYMTLLIASMVILCAVKREQPIYPDYGSYDHGFVSLIFALVCLESIQRWVLKERIFRIYPSWPISCLLSFIFQHIPLYVASMLASNSTLEHDLWRSYDISSFILALALDLIVFFHSCYGLYQRKSYFIFDASALYLIILCPYRWKSPSNKVTPYRPEIGHFNSKMKAIYLISIFLSIIGFLIGIMDAIILLYLNMHWISELNPIVSFIIGKKKTVKAVFMMLLPALIPVANGVICIICNFYQQRALREYAERLLTRGGRHQ